MRFQAQVSGDGQPAVAFGFALEYAGGSETQGAWIAAFAMTALVMLLGPFALRLGLAPR